MNRREFNICLIGAFGSAAYAMQRFPTALRINAARLMEHLTGLARFGKTPDGGVSRVAYSEADCLGREYVLGLMREAGLATGIDAAGNITGMRPGGDPRLAPIVIGSHIDTVPNGGNYDGTVGVLGAIEAAHTIAESQRSLRHPLEILVYQNEEGGQFGSRLLIGSVREGELDLVSQSGKTIREGIRFIGGNPENLGSVVRKTGDIAACLELHIEQGGFLEEKKIQIGIVEGIVGIRRWEVSIEGTANHAGTTPMNMRRDALLAGARLVDAVNRTVTAEPGRQVGTVGRLQALPGAPNVIPGSVTLTIELRDLEWDKLEDLHTKIAAEAKAIERTTGTQIAFRQIYANPPAPTDPLMREAMQRVAGILDYSTALMPSGAGHDSQGMARIAPIGMIFIPSMGGISHSPREYSHPEDIERGANMLLGTVRWLDSAAP